MNSHVKYRSIFVTVQVPSESHLLTVSFKRAKKTALQEAILRLEDRVNRFRTLSDIHHVALDLTNKTINGSNRVRGAVK